MTPPRSAHLQRLPLSLSLSVSSPTLSPAWLQRRAMAGLCCVHLCSTPCVRFGFSNWSLSLCKSLLDICLFTHSPTLCTVFLLSLHAQFLLTDVLVALLLLFQRPLSHHPCLPPPVTESLCRALHRAPRSRRTAYMQSSACWRASLHARSPSCPPQRLRHPFLHNRHRRPACLHMPPPIPWRT